MSVLEVRVIPDRVLRQPARRVTEFSGELRAFARDLIETMYARDGIGLAAPQVGRLLQVFVANPSQRRGHEVVVVNPVLESPEGRTAVVEGCLSIPKVWERVRRAARVHLRGQQVDGKPLSLRAEGLLAIVLQHEVDHLQGRLLLDRLSWVRRLRLRAASCA